VYVSMRPVLSNTQLAVVIVASLVIAVGIFVVIM